MWAALSYILVFVLCWWAISFIIGAAISLLIHRFKLFEYDVFDAPTPVPIIAVAIVGVFAAYHFLRVGFDTHPPFGGQQAQMEVANANAPKVEAANLDGGLRYEPPLVPISIELTRRGVSVTLEGKLQTPMGTFAAFSVASVPFSSGSGRTLTVVLREQAYVYALDDRRFSVQLPNDLRGKSQLFYDGNGNVKVVISNPVVRHSSGE
jgi:hypothetical protein